MIVLTKAPLAAWGAFLPLALLGTGGRIKAQTSASAEARPSCYALFAKGFQEEPCSLAALGANLELLAERTTPAGLEIALSPGGSRLVAAYFERQTQGHFVQLLDPLLRPLSAPTPLPEFEGIHMLGRDSLFLTEESLWIFCWEARPLAEPPFNEVCQTFHRFALPSEPSPERPLSASRVPPGFPVLKAAKVLGIAGGAFLVLSEGSLFRIPLDGSSTPTSLDLGEKMIGYKIEFMDAAPSWRLSDEELSLATNGGRIIEIALPQLRPERERMLPGFPRDSGARTWARSVQIGRGELFVSESPQGYEEMARILRFDFETLSERGAWEPKGMSTFAALDGDELVAGGGYPAVLLRERAGERTRSPVSGYLYRLVAVR